MRRNQRQRGFSMLVVMGLLLIVTVAAVTTLQMVGQEASLQAQTRREAEAFFAAEAGLAEARESMRLRAEAATNFQTYTTVMGALTAVPNMGANGETWFEVIPQTSYTLTRAGAELAMDSNITAAGREFNDAAGARFTDYPQSINVRYRVFLRDDVDEASPVATTDSNAQVWLVSIGEVDIGGGMPIRRVTQALITFSAGAANIDCLGQKGGCADKTNAAVLDANAPSGTTRSL